MQVVLNTRFLLAVFIYSVTCCNNSFSQKKQNNDHRNFLKLNIDFRKYDSKNYYFENWQPAFVWSYKKKVQEIGFTQLSYKKNIEVDEYYIRGFDMGLRYYYKYQVADFFYPLVPSVGLSFACDYYASHAEPIRPTIYKEFYLKTLTCTFAANASLSYEISKRFVFDCDFPFPFWSVRFSRQRDILPVTREKRILADQEFSYPPNYFFNFRAGIRYKIN